MESTAGTICCPVCTLYLREGVTLQSHLNTHPKDQVIEALIRCTNSEGRLSSKSGSTRELLQQDDGPVAQPASQSQQPSYPLFGSSHFTTAITYQQFLSSYATAGGTLVPQYVSVPTILAAPGQTPSPALMPVLYNPYLVQQQQQQVQFFNSVSVQSPQTVLPPHRQILPASTDGDSSPSPKGNNTIDTSVSVHEVQTCAKSSKASEIHRTNSGDGTPDNPVIVDGDDPSKLVSDECNEQKFSKTDINNRSPSPTTDDLENTELSEISVFHKTLVTRNDSSEEVIPESDSSLKSVPKDGPDKYDDYDEKSDSRSDITSEIDRAGIDLSGNNDKSTEHKEKLDTVDQTDDCVEEEEDEEEEVETDMGIDSGLYSIRNDADGALDLSDTDRETLLVEVPSTPTNSSDEFITPDCTFPENLNSVVIPNNQRAERVMTKNLNSTELESLGEGKLLNLGSSSALSRIEVDGIHIFLPTQFLNPKVSVSSTSDAQQPVKEPDASKIDANISLIENLDIQTDEMMPPRGELSEQESNGGNDSSWSQAFQRCEDDVSTSYDLLARESWGASDGSDAEGNIECSYMGSSCSQILPDIIPPAEISSTSTSLKAYKCWCCNEAFDCPKERRVHQSKCHSSLGECSNSSSQNSSSKNYEADNEKLILKRRIRPKKLKITKVVSVNNSNDVKLESNEILTDSKLSIKSVEIVVSPDANSSSMPVKSEQNVESDIKEENENQNYLCIKCMQTFNNPRLLQYHVRTTHRDSRYTCITCQEKFPCENEYLVHLKVHPLECPTCGKYFYRHQNLSLHLRRHMGIKPFKCGICDKGFVTRQKLAEHTNSHTGNAPFKCTQCDESFRRYSNLIQHRNRYHLKVKKKIKDYFCHCGDVFHSKQKLEWHKEIHDEKPKSCTFCCERFVHMSSLTRHIRRAHDQRFVPKLERERENVECPVCSCVFLKTSLASHMRIHSGEKPFGCPICGKTFSTKWNLQLHKWTHASRSTKPFKCSLCKSAFYRQSDYTAHMHSHKNVRPYTCNYCGCQFIRKYNCLRHVREHEANKSYTCNICNKTFHRSYYLTEHMRVHSGIRPYTCHICGKASATKSNHNKHVKIHHAREPVNTEG